MVRLLMTLAPLAAGVVQSAAAQSRQVVQGSAWNRTGAVPRLTGFVGFITAFRPGSKSLDLAATPIVRIPCGGKWLVEAEGECEDEFEYEEGAWSKPYGKHLENLQPDFLSRKWVVFLYAFGCLILWRMRRAAGGMIAPACWRVPA